MTKRTIQIGIDFDGTIAHYDGWKGAASCGEPIAGAKEFLSSLVGMGFLVVIFSARASEFEGRRAIWDWVHQHGLQDLIHDVTHEKRYAFMFTVDDRAVSFTGSYSAVLDQLLERLGA